MLLQVFPSGPFLTNAYVVACDATKEAAIVDPGVDSAEKIIRFIQENSFTPTKILLTHSHWDHTADVAKLKEFYHIPVSIHPLDAPNLENPGADGLPMFYAVTPVKEHFPLTEGDTVQIGHLAFQVIETPGHTPGGIVLFNSKENILLSGDTLFKGSIGNLSFPGCDSEKMWASLKKLETLPPQTIVYPGHGPSTTIGQESWLPDARSIFGGD